MIRKSLTLNAFLILVLNYCSFGQGSNCNFAPGILVSSCHSNATENTVADDYITFTLQPSQDSVMSGRKYSITATQNGNPIAITLSDGSAATNLYFGYPSPFRTVNGTAGQGSITLTITASNGCATTQAIILADPGTCSAPSSTCALDSISYTYRLPFQSADLNLTQLPLPQFNTNGGTKTLTSAQLDYSIEIGTVIVAENNSTVPESAEISMGGNASINLGSTTIFSGSFANISTGLQSFAQSLIVPPAFNGSTWPGDSLTGVFFSTTQRMKSLGLTDYMSSIYVDPTMSDAWVTSITSDNTTDDDIKIKSGSSVVSGNSIFNTPSSLIPFIGTGNVNLSVSTLTGLTITGGGGNIVVDQMDKAYAEVTVKYYFTISCIGSIGSNVWLDDNKDGVQDANEVGLAGVTVDLYLNGTDGLPSTNDDVLVGATVTDSYGNYNFTELTSTTIGNSATEYNVSFTPPANYTFSPLVAGGGTDNQNNSNNDANPTIGLSFGRSGSIVLSPSEYDSTIDAGLILTAAQTASVGNFVWIDADNDGSQGIGELGIASVPVMLIDDNATVVAATMTDKNGEYLFDNVQPGTGYTVQFGQPIIYVPTKSIDPVNDEKNSDIDPVTLTSLPFDVNPGEAIRYVDAGFLPQDSNKASLGSRVWYDTDFSGTQDPTETGVAGIIVILYDAIGTNMLATTQTDALGNYVFNDLDAGTYVVGFDPTKLPAGANFAAQNSGADDELDSDPDLITGLCAPVTLAAGTRNMSIDAGIYNALNDNSIGSQVWYDANKDGIQNVNESGVSGVTVTLYDGTGNPLAITTTNTNGSYLFPGLADATYLVGFSNLPLGFVFTQENALNSTALDNSDANEITGKTGQLSLFGGDHISYINAGIYPKGTPAATASLGNKVWYDLNNDGIQELSETGVEGVTVTLLDAGIDGTLGNGDDGPSKTITTNSQGEYLFVNLVAGNYAIEFTNLPAAYKSSLVSNAGNDDTKDSDVPGGFATGLVSQVVSLKTGEENVTIDMGINKPLVNTLGNFVWLDADLNGRQGSSNLEPGVEGVQVTLLNANGSVYDKDPSTLGIQPYVTTTDANGYYLFTNFPDGNYSVRFGQFPSGYQLTLLDIGADNADSDADPNTQTTSSILLTGPVTNVTTDAGIYSTTKAALGNYIWNDADSDGIQDASEAPISGVLVTLYDAVSNPITTVATDDAGKYMFINLNPGTYNLGFANLPVGTEFTTPESTPSAIGSDVNPVTGLTSPIILAAGDVNLDIDAGVRPIQSGGLGNYVWYDLNNNGLQDLNEKGVPGVTATLTKVSTNQIVVTAVTDANGYYLFPELLPGVNQYGITFSTVPLNYIFTIQNGIISIANNSDANANGKTGTATVVGGELNANVDAGIIVNTPVPVTLKSFAAKSEACSVALTWATGVEENAIHFDVMRKAANENVFVKIGRVNTKGSNSDYTYQDASVNAGKYEYKLVMVDLDSKSNESNIAFVQVNCMEEIFVYPNPASANTTISINAKGKAAQYTIQLQDITGKVIYEKGLFVKDHENVNVPMQSLANGNYTIHVLSNGNKSVIKVEKRD